MDVKTLVASGAVAIASIVGLMPGQAMAQMTQQELDQNGVTVVAAPYQGGALHQLLILEQLAATRACWNELPSNSVTLVNPLLLGFDFSGICGRATDSNGFSVRMGGRDFDWRYALQVVNQDNDLVLIARSTLPGNTLPNLVIGRAGGTTSDFAKIRLEPGWRVTRRVAQGKITGHFYLTNDQSIEQVIALMQQRQPAATAATIAPTPSGAGITVPTEAPLEVNSVAPGVNPAAPTAPVFSVPPSPSTLR